MAKASGIKVIASNGVKFITNQATFSRMKFRKGSKHNWNNSMALMQKTNKNGRRLMATISTSKEQSGSLEMRLKRSLKIQ